MKMRFYYTIIGLVLSFLLLGPLYAQVNVEPIKIEAQELAEKGEYEKAIELWSSLALADDFESRYNQALAYMHLDNDLEAKWILLQLQKEYPNQALIKGQLSVLNTKMNIQQQEADAVWGITLGKSLIPSGLLAFLLLVLAAGVLLAMLVLHHPKQRTLKNAIFFSSLFIMIVLSAQLLWQNYQWKQLPDQLIADTQTWDYKKDDAIYWPKGMSVKLIKQEGTRVLLKNNFGEQVLLPEDVLYQSSN